MATRRECCRAAGIAVWMLTSLCRRYLPAFCAHEGWAQKRQRTIVFSRMTQLGRKNGSAGARVKQAMLRELAARLYAMSGEVESLIRCQR